MWVVGGVRLVTCINNRLCLPEVLQRGSGMEDSPSPKRAATIGCDDDRGSVCNGIGVDGER